MKMITSIVFEIKMSVEEVEAYKALSEKEIKTRVEEMKSELTKVITDECIEEPNFAKFTIEFQEGE